ERKAISDGGIAKANSKLALRIGIGTGLVIVGDLIGEGSAQEQAVVGEAPNLAARLQALAEPKLSIVGLWTGLWGSESPPMCQVNGSLLDCERFGCGIKATLHRRSGRERSRHRDIATSRSWRRCPVPGCRTSRANRCSSRSCGASVCSCRTR